MALDFGEKIGHFAENQQNLVEQASFAFSSKF